MSDTSLVCRKVLDLGPPWTSSLARSKGGTRPASPPHPAPALQLQLLHTIAERVEEILELKTMKAGKPFLIAGVPIAGLAALHSLSFGTGAAGVASAWTPQTTTSTTTASSSFVVRSSHSRVVGGGHRHALHPSKSSSSSNNLLLYSSSSTYIEDSNLQLHSLHLTPELQMMTSAFASIPDEKTRHKQLLYMASKLPDVPDTVRVPENKVPGCLSTVHVDCVVEKRMTKTKKITSSTEVDHTNDDDHDDHDDDHEEQQWVVNYFGDSDGLLTKGLLALLIR